MNVTSGKTGTLSSELYTKTAQYRYKVFIETLGWELQTKNGEELDQFDRPDTLYVVAQDDVGNVNGCARLLPTPLFRGPVSESLHIRTRL